MDPIAYGTLLRRFLADKREVDLMRAYELGKTLQNRKVTPDELLAMHMEAIDNLPEGLAEDKRLEAVMSSFSFLLEAMIAYGIAYSDAYQLLEQAANDAENAKFELERLVAELDLANHQLVEVDRLKSRFFSNMSHELRTPLNAIISCTEDLLDGLEGELAPGQRRYVTIASEAANHLLGVINEILDLAKLKSGTFQLERQPLELAEVLKELENTMGALALKRGLTLEIADTRGLPPVLADRTKLLQILLNLTSNALKFTPEGGAVRITGELEDNRVLVAVADNGVGIAATDLPHIFEEFRQAEPGLKDKRGSTGLGLAITRQLVELHGGTITASSQPRVGSTFRFTLPLAGVTP